MQFISALCQPHPTSQNEYISVLQRVIGSKDFTTTKRRSRTKVIQMTLPFQAIHGTLERNNVFPTLTWSVIKSVTGYSNISKRCLLCLAEKLFFLKTNRQIDRQTDRQTETDTERQRDRETSAMFCIKGNQKSLKSKKYIINNCCELQTFIQTLVNAKSLCFS